jgi:hypothetical protein
MDANNNRRKLLQASLIAPVALGVPARLHGVPASIDTEAGASKQSERLVLPIASAGIPGEEVLEVSRIAAVIENVLTDDASAKSFFSAPSKYLISHGLDGSDATLSDATVRILVALTDPVVKEALKKNNYVELFEYLSVTGLFEKRNPAMLQQRIEQLIESNIDGIKQAIYQDGLAEASDNVFTRILERAGVGAEEEDLSAVSQILNGVKGPTIAACSAMAACVVGIALMAAVYVSVAIAATVAVLAAVTISAAMMVAITVRGQEHQIQLASTPFSGQFTTLDPAAVRNMQKAFRLAEISRDRSLHLYTLRAAIRDEVQAVLLALSKLQIINTGSTPIDVVADAVAMYAYKAAGIPRGD